jgi:hypothetical protein
VNPSDPPDADPEDEADVEAFDAAVEELRSGRDKTVPWEEAKRDLGLDEK